MIQAVHEDETTSTPSSITADAGEQPTRVEDIPMAIDHIQKIQKDIFTGINSCWRITIKFMQPL